MWNQSYKESYKRRWKNPQTFVENARKCTFYNCKEFIGLAPGVNGPTGILAMLSLLPDTGKGRVGRFLPLTSC
jgi:hypothetical protein